MFKIGVQMWQFNNPNTMEVFKNAFFARDKQFKVWWTPLYSRAELVHCIQAGLVKVFNMANYFKKYYY